jgi:aspartyl-tRNA(Asn)/glutamyl-tRNA(Gln) amidotransferase subunit B
LSELGILPQRVAELAQLIDANKLAPSSAGPIFDKLMEEDAPAEEVAKSLGLIQVSDTGAIDAAIDALIAQNPPPLQDFRSGRQQAMGALVGMIMRSGKGLNPKMVQERLKERLAGGA